MKKLFLILLAVVWCGLPLMAQSTGTFGSANNGVHHRKHHRHHRHHHWHHHHHHRRLQFFR